MKSGDKFVALLWLERAGVTGGDLFNRRSARVVFGKEAIYMRTDAWQCADHHRRGAETDEMDFDGVKIAEAALERRPCQAMPCARDQVLVRAIGRPLGGPQKGVDRLREPARGSPIVGVRCNP